MAGRGDRPRDPALAPAGLGAKRGEGRLEAGGHSDTALDGHQVVVGEVRRDDRLGEDPHRFALSAPEIPGMREWWDRYCRGLWRYDGEAVRRDKFWAISVTRLPR